jgi:CBS-domain-containing membrane protein
MSLILIEVGVIFSAIQRNVSSPRTEGGKKNDAACHGTVHMIRDQRVQYSVALQKSPWSESASELYRTSDRSLSAELVSTFGDRECHVVSVTDPYGRILDFLDMSRYFLSSSSSVVLKRMSGSRSRPTTSQKIW